jgi:DNA-binding transcriptional LysR family regulator
VVPTADPLRGRSLAVADLVSHRLVALPPGTGGRAALDAACAAAGVAPVVACEATGLDMICLLAERGLGTGVVPASVAAAAADRLRALPLDPPVTSHIELAWRTGGPSSPAGAALLAVARRHVEAARER